MSKLSVDGAGMTATGYFHSFCGNDPEGFVLPALIQHIRDAVQDAGALALSVKKLFMGRGRRRNSLGYLSTRLVVRSDTHRSFGKSKKVRHAAGDRSREATPEGA